MFAPRTAPAEVRAAPPNFQDVKWTVRLTGTAIDPTTVPRRLRCTYVGGRSEWPAFNNPANRLSGICHQLIALGGSHCHACHLRQGVVVDHDRFTGLVRGLLCTHCNAHVDTCPHPAACPWANYLNAPPAIRLELPYPPRAATRRYNQQRIDHFGFDPLP